MSSGFSGDGKAAGAFALPAERSFPLLASGNVKFSAICPSVTATPSNRALAGVSGLSGIFLRKLARWPFLGGSWRSHAPSPGNGIFVASAVAISSTNQHGSLDGLSAQHAPARSEVTTKVLQRIKSSMRQARHGEAHMPL